MRGSVTSALASSSRLRSSSVSWPASVFALPSSLACSSASTQASLAVPVRLAAPVGRADEDVLERGQPGEGPRDLKRPGDAGAAVLVAGEAS